MTIDPDITVAELLERHPAALPVLVAHGFKPLANPVMRRTMARLITLRGACARRDVDLDTVLDAIAAAETPDSDRCGEEA
ncbi:MAG: DUF1858 domain-containing protein [Planctomycetota bacterium]